MSNLAVVRSWPLDVVVGIEQREQQWLLVPKEFTRLRTCKRIKLIPEQADWERCLVNNLKHAGFLWEFNEGLRDGVMTRLVINCHGPMSYFCNLLMGLSVPSLFAHLLSPCINLLFNYKKKSSRLKSCDEAFTECSLKIGSFNYTSVFVTFSLLWQDTRCNQLIMKKGLFWLIV
jgi:hypothetical protein